MSDPAGTRHAGPAATDVIWDDAGRIEHLSRMVTDLNDRWYQAATERDALAARLAALAPLVEAVGRYHEAKDADAKAYLAWANAYDTDASARVSEVARTHQAYHDAHEAFHQAGEQVDAAYRAYAAPGEGSGNG